MQRRRPATSASRSSASSTVSANAITAPPVERERPHPVAGGEHQPATLRVTPLEAQRGAVRQAARRRHRSHWWLRPGGRCVGSVGGADRSTRASTSPRSLAGVAIAADQTWPAGRSSPSIARQLARPATTASPARIRWTSRRTRKAVAALTVRPSSSSRTMLQHVARVGHAQGAVRLGVEVVQRQRGGHRRRDPGQPVDEGDGNGQHRHHQRHVGERQPVPRRRRHRASSAMPRRSPPAGRRRWPPAGAECELDACS